MDIVDNENKFIELRERYPEFCYNGYDWQEDNEALTLMFEFEVPGLVKFTPRTRILKKDLPWQDLSEQCMHAWVFNIGLAELVSYWKATCSPKVVIKCGVLTVDQVAWWKKLYYYGLGELFYRNDVKVSQDDFMMIDCNAELGGDTLEVEERVGKFEKRAHEFSDYVHKVAKLDGYLIPIGGGKDSNVTLEALDIDYARDFVAIVNPKYVTKKCAELAGFRDERIVEVERKIDENLLKLNQQGFINGHTPFSSVLAFYLSFAAEKLGKKYVVVSNEDSANEANVSEVDANHQYSKSFEFEEDFRLYAKKYLRTEVEYFSFLRPLNELEIAKIFSRYEKYFDTFKSCNVGSKTQPWHWCCNCAKCLFAYIILAPYLYKDKLVEIFGEDLFVREDLWTMLLQLTGDYANKPFECVGTYAEVRLALRLVIDKYKDSLPVLLAKYNNEYGQREVDLGLLTAWNMENNLTSVQEDLLKEALNAKR